MRGSGCRRTALASLQCLLATQSKGISKGSFKSRVTLGAVFFPSLPILTKLEDVAER